MRVISQDGKTDIPYEYFAFSMAGIGGGYSIIATRNIAEPPTVAINSVIATYSAKEKAVKAMEILRSCYRNGVDTDTGAEIRNNVFQFPQDDEIEVVE